MGISADTVRQAVAGDLDATMALVAASRQELTPLMSSVGTLTVTATAAERVLREAAAERARAAAAVQWSRLARNGLLQPGSRDVFQVEYAAECEDAIAEAVLRLDDLPEYPIGPEELTDLLAGLHGGRGID